jgi:hypothetical protein
MDKVRAKFQVDSLEQSDDYNYKTLKMSACTTDEGDGIDFTHYTPWGELEMGIDGDVPAAKFFEPGETYYVEFIKIENDEVE